ncbi:MAG: GNAT family N-acetyltransferase [Rhizobiales bacterium]|nr:GNAT family N-acetyltransferase [Hyphomicrobiales bacterium]
MDHPKLPRGYFRRLTSADRGHFEDHLRRLDRESRRNRFGGAVTDAFLKEYASRALDQDGVAFGYVVDGELRGAGELRLLHDAKDEEAEAAFSVESEWRRQGVAAGLFRRIIDSGRSRGVARILVVCLPHNTAMQGLTRKFDGELIQLAPDALGVIEPAKDDAASRWRDAVRDAADFAAAIFDTGGAIPTLAPWAAALRARRSQRAQI